MHTGVVFIVSLMWHCLVFKWLHYVCHYCCGQCSRIRIFRFFSDFKKHDFLRFFYMTYQKVVKSHQQKFSPQYVTKE